MSKSQSVTDQLMAILKEVKEGADDALQVGLRKVPSKVARQLRSTSPENPYGQGKKYKDGWSVKKVDKHLSVVHNKTKPGLTHLLENGHMIKNKFGSYGRTNGIPHIKPAEEEGQAQFLDAVMEELNRKF